MFWKISERTYLLAESLNSKFTGCDPGSGVLKTMSNIYGGALLQKYLRIQ